MRLSSVSLRVTDPASLARFYQEMLGMDVRDTEAGLRVGYAGVDADLILCPGGGAYSHDRGQRYWKIGITLPDVDLAATWLAARGVAVSTPGQFGQIGYMCHLNDPEGFVIELLQHDFEANKPAGNANPNAPFAEACIGQITLRTGDIEAEDSLCRDLGMTLLSLQDVAEYGFDLHFYAFTDETPPVPELWSVDNREWLWKRPYTLLEFQHVQGASFVPAPDLLGIGIEGMSAPRKDAFGGTLLPE